MKKIVPFILWLLPTAAFPQFIYDSSSDDVYYEYIINTPLTKEDNFKKMELWYVDAFKYPSKVLEYSNIEAGKIVTAGSTKIQTDVWGYLDMPLRFRLTLDTKDNKIRARFSNLEYGMNREWRAESYFPNHKMPDKPYKRNGWAQLKDQTALWSEAVVISLKDAIFAVEEDW